MTDTAKKVDEPKLVSEADMELAIERKMEHEKNGDADPESGEYLDEIYDIVDAVVSRSDDPTMPANTFRVWFLGTIMCAGLAALTTLFSFRTNSFSPNPIMGVLIAYPFGLLMAAVLPRGKIIGDFSLNPGKFSFKEHGLIYVFCNAAIGNGNAYAVYNIVLQKYKLGQDLNTVAAYVFCIVTQIFGYGMAGLCRRYLVRPAAMLWPSNLSIIAMLNSFHEHSSDDSTYKMSRVKFFWIAAGGMFCYSFFPNFIMPILTSFSLMCYMAPQGSTARFLGSATNFNGMGIFAITLDWNVIATAATFPITSPLWAVLNQCIGLIIVMWILTPALYVSNAFGLDQGLGSNPLQGPNGSNGQATYAYGHALNTGHLFDKDGKHVSAASFLNLNNLTLNEAHYDAKKPIYITTYFALTYTISFVVFTAAIVHCALWYGKDIWHRFRSTVRDLDTTDIHAKLMDVYADVPDLWYIILLCINLVAAILVCQFGGFDLPWWGVILGFALALVSILPIGVIQAISGQQIGLNVMSEFLIGLILPGRIAAVMSFKTLSYMAMAMGLSLVADLKLGHYMKIPPRAMFSVQLFASILGAIVNTATAMAIYEQFGRDPSQHFIEDDPTSPLVWKLDSSPPNGWSATGYGVFLSAGAIWGAIGPARFFGPGSPYFKTLIGFAVGLVAPVIPWLLHRQYPNGYWHLVNIPVIAVISFNAGSTNSMIISSLVISIFVNFYLKKYRHAWWKKYAYVMSAAFDAGLAFCLAVIFSAFQSNPDFIIGFPAWGGNRADAENCAPDWYLTCTDNANHGGFFNKTYDIHNDPYCSSINFQNKLHPGH
ncbi:hypothetical protein HK101_011579 [Irineochytrium annulatum]|nr:hypothetical protein HK101_011579 [Irineochytrium annulatum]